MNGERDGVGFVLRKKDTGLYYLGSGYGGPGNPVPYFGAEIRDAKVYRTPLGADRAARKTGAHVGIAELDEWGAPKAWKGWAVMRGGEIAAQE